ATVSGTAVSVCPLSGSVSFAMSVFPAPSTTGPEGDVWIANFVFPIAPEYESEFATGVWSEAIETTCVLPPQSPGPVTCVRRPSLSAQKYSSEPRGGSDRYVPGA